MKVLFFAKTNVFSSPVSANVNSGPRISKGIGFASMSSNGFAEYGTCGVNSVVVGGIVVRRKGGKVSEIGEKEG